MEPTIIKFVKEFLALYLGLTDLFYQPGEKMLFVDIKHKGLKVYDAILVTNMTMYRLGSPEFGDDDHQKVLSVLQMYFHTTHQSMFWYVEPTEKNVQAGPQTFLTEAQLILKATFKEPGVKTCSIDYVFGTHGQLDNNAFNIIVDGVVYDYDRFEELISPEIFEELMRHLHGTITYEGVSSFYF